MMLLFVPPQNWVAAIQRWREASARQERPVLLYDGQCGFCKASVSRLAVLDVFGQVQLQDFYAAGDLSALHPALTQERCRSEMVLIEPGGRLSGGFGAFQRLCARLVMLKAFAPLVHLPGAAWIGSAVYRWVASHRYLLWPRANQCAVASEAGSAKT
jgi:predicted DCC family thiol-disulfide oxidoreductase YuxK